MDTETFYGSKVVHQRILQDAYITIEDSKHGGTIVITGPPSNGEDSDVEVEDENDIVRNPTMPDEVVGELDVFLDDGRSSSDEEYESSQPQKKMKRKDQPKWTSDHISSSDYSRISEGNKNTTLAITKVCPELENLSAFELYNELFSEMADLIVAETQRYASRDKNDPSFAFTKNTFWNFLGLLLLSGINIRTSERDYWSKSPALECRVFIQTMSRNKFQQIKSYLHVAENQSLIPSKMAKI